MRTLLLLIAMMPFLTVGGAYARTTQTVEAPVAPGVVARAAYSGEGHETGGNPVLILHGFLQTHDFFTVRRLHQSLADADYPVLSPTLSLGISGRAQSLGCEAVHLHTLDDDVAELHHWVQWLYGRQGRPVVLIGHSAGGLVITRYLEAYPDAPVARAILVSVSDLLGGERADARTEGDLEEFSLGFCQRYVSTREAYNSYSRWDARSMLDAMIGFRGPVAVILGSADDRIDVSWRNLLRESGIRVVNVEGADHFFDSAHEFDLLEAVEGLLAH
ncbi:MAG: alpha/beta hydrolase [Gammaproteobacteria bacterium]